MNVSIIPGASATTTHSQMRVPRRVTPSLRHSAERLAPLTYTRQREVPPLAVVTSFSFTCHHRVIAVR